MVVKTELNQHFNWTRKKEAGFTKTLSRFKLIHSKGVNYKNMQLNKIYN